MALRLAIAQKKNTAKKINYRVKSGLHVKEGEKNNRGWNRQKVAATVKCEEEWYIHLKLMEIKRLIFNLKMFVEFLRI